MGADGVSSNGAAIWTNAHTCQFIQVRGGVGVLTSRVCVFVYKKKEEKLSDERLTPRGGAAGAFFFESDAVGDFARKNKKNSRFNNFPCPRMLFFGYFTIHFFSSFFF